MNVISKVQGMEAFAKNLEATLHALGLDVKEASERTSFRRATIYRWLNCERSPSLEDAAKIADALGVSLDSLVGRDREDVTPQRQYLDALIKELGVKEVIRRVLAFDAPPEKVKPGHERDLTDLKNQAGRNHKRSNRQDLPER